MTDTRKEFEEWFLHQYGVHFKYAEVQFDHAQETKLAWQACQQLNDKRIADLLAVIAKKDEALIKACELIEKFSLQVYNGSDCLMVYDAVELQPADVELVEVGTISGGDIFIHSDLAGSDRRIYTIKTKGQNNAANS